MLCVCCSSRFGRCNGRTCCRYDLGVVAVAVWLLVKFLWYWGLAPWRMHKEDAANEPNATNDELAPAKFYSKVAKERIVDALDELSSILNRDGDAIKQLALSVVTEWGRQTTKAQHGKVPDVLRLAGQLETLEKLATVFHQKLYDSNGLLDQFDKCREELTNILSQNSDQTSLTHLIYAARNFAAGVATLEYLHDQQQISRMMRLVLNVQLDGFHQAENNFMGWLRQTTIRSANLRESLSEGN